MANGAYREISGAECEDCEQTSNWIALVLLGFPKGDTDERSEAQKREPTLSSGFTFWNPELDRGRNSFNRRLIELKENKFNK